MYPKNLTLFANEKLVAPEISMGGNFSYDKNGRFYSSTTIYGYIKREGVTDSYKSLLAILNSQLFWWYLVNTGTVLANGYFRFMPHYTKPFPMPEIPQKTALMLEKLVDEILAEKTKDKNANTKKFEEKINDIVYDLYNLTTAEVEFIQKV
ncbi:TaqI-like C-terminal specificity domain-containing protein [Pedobacter montanisoli]|nr:TaqI-like C-terminal specificity domain-containing protein [Pedobacter montanisoli]